MAALVTGILALIGVFLAITVVGAPVTLCLWLVCSAFSTIDWRRRETQKVLDRHAEMVGKQVAAAQAQRS